MDPEILRKRLLFRCENYGTHELDVLLGAYAREALATMDLKDLKTFDALLTADLPDLYDWITGAQQPPEEKQSKILKALQERCGKTKR